MKSQHNLFWCHPLLEPMQELIFDKPVGLELELEVESIYGVKIPKIQPPTFSKELPFSPIGAGARTLEAAAQFQNLVEAIIKVAATENKLRRIGEEIKKTSRRVNAPQFIFCRVIASTKF